MLSTAQGARAFTVAGVLDEFYLHGILINIQRFEVFVNELMTEKSIGPLLSKLYIGVLKA
jgi:hypothetical protein